MAAPNLSRALMRTARASAVLVILLVFPGPAVAQSHRWEIGLSAVYGQLIAASLGDPAGAGAGLSCALVLSEAFDLRAGVSWTHHSIEGNEQIPSYSFDIQAAHLGLGLRLDAIPMAPRLEAALGLLRSQGTGGPAALDLGIRLGLLLGGAVGPPGLWIGFGIYYHGFLTDITRLPVYLEIGPRVAWRWGTSPGRN